MAFQLTIICILPHPYFENYFKALKIIPSSVLKSVSESFSVSMKNVRYNQPIPQAIVKRIMHVGHKLIPSGRDYSICVLAGT